MKPTLEQIKTDASVWPDGASHFIDNYFSKWVDGAEFAWVGISSGWRLEDDSWPLEEYEKSGDFNIIPRPTKAEWVPKVGEWCLSSGGAKVFYVGSDYDDKHIFMLEQRGLTRYETLDGFKALKTERELFVESARAVWNGTYVSESILGELYDAGCRFMEPTK